MRLHVTADFRHTFFPCPAQSVGQALLCVCVFGPFDAALPAPLACMEMRVPGVPKTTFQHSGARISQEMQEFERQMQF